MKLYAIITAFAIITTLKGLSYTKTFSALRLTPQEITAIYSTK